jgi:hypothetical protein
MSAAPRRVVRGLHNCVCFLARVDLVRQTLRHVAACPWHAAYMCGATELESANPTDSWPHMTIVADDTLIRPPLSYSVCSVRVSADNLSVLAKVRPLATTCPRSCSVRTAARAALRLKIQLTLKLRLRKGSPVSHDMALSAMGLRYNTSEAQHRCISHSLGHGPERTTPLPEIIPSTSHLQATADTRTDRSAPSQARLHGIQARLHLGGRQAGLDPHR